MNWEAMHVYRTHDCGGLRKGDVGQKIRLSGWVHRVRDHGGILFIDLRDRYGVTQVLAEPSSEIFHKFEALRAEWVICIDGIVHQRTEDTINQNMRTGEIEVVACGLRVLSIATDVPLPVFGEPDYPEDVRLKYRYLDLRREKMRNNIILRSEVIQFLRQFMLKQDFLEIQTPILTASSPEGARDFLVPSRLHSGKFYALPQAPQVFKQLLMIAGFDKYFQIAPCFRDEDARADRSPGEFYQLDIEMSFVEQEDVFRVIEPLLLATFEKFLPKKIVSKKFPRIPYWDALRMYGTDKPDLRNSLVMQQVTDDFRGSSFKIFSNMIEEDPEVVVRGIPAPSGGNRAFCDRMNAWAIGEGQAGLGYIFWKIEDGVISGSGPIAKNLGEKKTEDLRSKFDLTAGDAVFFIAGSLKKTMQFSAHARNNIAENLGLIDENFFEFCWIIDFPMYQSNPDTGKIEFFHNPFSMPQGGMAALETQNPLDILAYQYDIVCNGVELSSGAIRNSQKDLMVKAFGLAGYSLEDIEKRFSAVFQAFQYGAPPHGGIAPGIDRMVMLLAGAESIRDVIPFPLNQKAEDLMMQAPSDIDDEHMKLLGLRKINFST
jgi:aspartyl-tRNA synthetase